MEQCVPPKGTEAYTFHWLGSEEKTDLAPWWWDGENWMFAGEAKRHSPKEVYELLWRYIGPASHEDANRANFQARVRPWLIACFGEEIAGDKIERNHRFLEEALETVQAGGCTASEAHQLVDYVFGRPVGELPQEVGGVMNTLAALCLAHGLDMHECAEVELARVWTKVEKIRAKQAAKPKHSPLPEHTASPDDAAALAEARMQAIADDSRVEMVCEDLEKARAELAEYTAASWQLRAQVAALEAQNAAMRAALEDIGVYGCGMLNQPAAMNGPEEVWLQKRICRMEEVARASLARSSGGEVEL